MAVIVRAPSTIVRAPSQNIYMEYSNTAEEVIAYNYKTSTWTNEAYRTIVLDEPATGELLKFLEANATKLS